MEIKEQLKLLSEICGYDLRINEAKEKLTKLKKDSHQASQEASTLKNIIDDFGNTKEQCLKKRRALDERLQSEKSNLRKWEARAEKIKGEREYTALMSEISSQKRTISGIEAELSEVTDELKKVEASLKKTSGEHDEKLGVANQAHDSVKELLAEEETELSKLEGKRSELTAKLPKPLFARYQRIYNGRAHQGISQIFAEVCQACMRTVPPELYIRVLRGELIEQCPSCLRILVAANQPNENEEEK